MCLPRVAREIARFVPARVSAGLIMELIEITEALSADRDVPQAGFTALRIV
jgi:hypothetical protein